MTPVRRSAAALGIIAGVALWTAGCSTIATRPVAPLPVQHFADEIVVTVWTEPSRLPAGGGDAQVLVRVKKKAGGSAQGVEVRLQATAGTLYSQGRVLLTDSRGMTRDRLSTHEAALVTVNAGGTPFSLRVDVGPAKD